MKVIRALSLAIAFLVPENEGQLQVTFSPSALGALLRWESAQ